MSKTPFRTPSTIGSQIRERRRMLGMSQGDLATATGLQSAIISHYETGRRNPSLSSLKPLATALHCAIGDFFDPTAESVRVMCPTCEGRGCVLQTESRRK